MGVVDVVKVVVGRMGRRVYVRVIVQGRWISVYRVGELRVVGVVVVVVELVVVVSANIRESSSSNKGIVLGTVPFVVEIHVVVVVQLLEERTTARV
jgi:hypothetical protein